MVNVAILGFGVVGSGVAEVLTGQGAGVNKKADELIDLKYILDVRQFPDSPFAGCFVQDFAVIENDPDVQVVVETIGGVGAALDFTERALKAGKSVVTSNKELVATHGPRLLSLAAEHGAAQILDGVFLAMVEDGYVHLLAPANGKIQLHVFRRKSVFVDQGANDPLPDQLLLRFLDLFAGNVVERVSRRDRVLGLLVLLSAHIKTPFTEAGVISGRPRRNPGLCVSVALSMRRCPFGRIATGLGP